jgi:hypothetical protein
VGGVEIQGRHKMGNVIRAPLELNIANNHLGAWRDKSIQDENGRGMFTGTVGNRRSVDLDRGNCRGILIKKT